MSSKPVRASQKDLISNKSKKENRSDKPRNFQETVGIEAGVCVIMMVTCWQWEQ